MGFFNFGTNKTTAAADTSSQPVILQLNEEEITVSAADAAGKTVRQLFDEYADDLGDTSRATRFVAAGQIVDATATVTGGTVYRGAMTSESKGHA